MKKSWRKIVLLVLVTLFAILWQGMGVQKVAPLYSLENALGDYMYRRPVGTSKNIKIIGVDEETLNAYGKFEDWSREKLAELIEKLS